MRTGFIVANEEIIHAYANANTILNLACGNVGPAIAGKLFEDREVSRIGREMIMPFLPQPRAMELAIEACSDLPVYVHKPEGAIFLWLWFKGLPVNSSQLYQLLKEAGCVIIPGHDSLWVLMRNGRIRMNVYACHMRRTRSRLRRGLRLLRAKCESFMRNSGNLQAAS